MLAHPNHIQTNYNLYQNKLIRIISPFSGEQFKIELGGKEDAFRELLATLLNIDSSYIKGLKDSYGNYYTLSSALNNLFIFSNENNLFSLVLNISNKNNNKYKHYNDSFDKNTLYNVNNNYHNRTEFNEIYIGNSNKKLMKSKSNYRYTTLIKELIPAINRNFRDNDNENESFYNEKWSLNRHPKFAKVLENLKEKFSKEQYKILKELLKMENITIINFFKLYEKSKDKKELIKNLNSLYKKYHKKIKYDSSSSDEDSFLANISKKSRKSKFSKKRTEKSFASSESEESSKHNKKIKHKRHKKKETSSSSSSENKSSKSSSKSKNKNTFQSKDSDDKESNSKSSKESEEYDENSEENKNNFPIKCSSLENLIDNIKVLFANKLVVNYLFTNDIDHMKKTNIQKTQLLKEEFEINNFTITKNAYEKIKNYYEDIMKKIIEKNMTEEEKFLLHKLIKKKNKIIKLRFIALLRHNNYENLSTDLKEGLEDYLKRKKGSEHKINLKKRNESISINSNSNTSNENDNNEKGEGNFADDNSSKSIRKNERMAKNNKKKNEQKSQKSKEEEESIGQFQLMEMNEGSKGNSTSKKSDNFTKSRKSSSKIANEKEEENFENSFIPTIKKMKEEGNLNITDNEVNILINEFNNKNNNKNRNLLLAFIEEYKLNGDQEEFIDSIGTFIKGLYNKKIYIEGQEVNIIDNNDDNVNNKDNNKKNIIEEEQPYEKEIIIGLKGLKFGKKGNKKIINTLLKNNVFTKEQMRNIEEDLDQNNNFIVGAFELIYITNNVKDLVENINIRLQLSQSEKENQILNKLEIIMKSCSEEEQNKVRELYESKDAKLMNILESEMNDIKKAKASILNFLEKN